MADKEPQQNAFENMDEGAQMRLRAYVELAWEIFEELSPEELDEILAETRSLSKH
jgi:hypothetical protein